MSIESTLRNPRLKWMVCLYLIQWLQRGEKNMLIAINLPVVTLKVESRINSPMEWERGRCDMQKILSTVLPDVISTNSIDIYCSLFYLHCLGRHNYSTFLWFEVLTFYSVAIIYRVLIYMESKFLCLLNFSHSSNEVYPRIICSIRYHGGKKTSKYFRFENSIFTRMVVHYLSIAI